MFKTVWDYLTENRKLRAENEKLHKTLELHTGDCCSLANEVELFRSHWQDAEERCDELQSKLEAIQNDD